MVHASGVPLASWHFGFYHIFGGLSRTFFVRLNPKLIKTNRFPSWHVGLYHIGSRLSRTFFRLLLTSFRASARSSSMNLSMFRVKRYVLLTSRPVSRTLRPSAVCTASWHSELYHIRSRMSTIILCFQKISCFRSIALLLQCKYGYIPHILGKTETFTARYRRYIDCLHTGYTLPVCDIRIIIRFYQVCKMRLCTPGYFPFWTAFSPR